jgi:hypothetical protein
MEGRGFFPVERADRPQGCAGALQRKIRPDDLDNIICLGHPLDRLFGYQSHAPKLPCGQDQREGDSRADAISFSDQIPATMNAKIASYYSGYFRSVAARNGYHPELAAVSKR